MFAQDKSSYEDHTRRAGQFVEGGLIESTDQACLGCADQCDQIGRFVGLWATFKAFGYN